MQFYVGKRSASLLLAAVSVAFALMFQLVQAELVSSAVTSGLDQAPATALAYHWWVMFTDNAAGLIKFKADDTNNMLSHAHPGSVESDRRVANNAAEQAGLTNNNMEYFVIHAKQNAHDVDHKAQQDVIEAEQQAQDVIKYVESEKLGHEMKREVGDAEQQVKEGDIQVAKRVKHMSQTVHGKTHAEGQWLAQGVESARSDVYHQSGWLHGMYCQLTEKVQAFGSATLGASSQLRSRLKAGLSKLNDLASTDDGKGADSAWPKSAVTGASKESIMQHVQNLHQVYQHAHAQLKSKLEAQGVVLEKIAGSYMSRRLPLTGLYGPLTALMLMYLVCDIWRHRADMRHRMRQRTEVATVGAEATHAFQQGILLASEAMVTASVYLAVVPMVIVLLVVMELNGSPSWLVISSYTCLLADMLVATNPVLLGGIWPGGDTGDVEQRLAAGITVFIAVCCLAQTVYG